MRKLMFDPIQLERESKMAKKAVAKGALNVSEAIRDALGKGNLGPAATHKEVGEYLIKKHPDNAKLAKSVANDKIWYQTVYVQRKKLSRGKKIANRKLVRAAIRGGADGGGISPEAAMMFALKCGGIDAAKKALDELAEKLKD